MSRQVLFIQGGGNGGYEADAALASSLQEALGKGYDVKYPRINSNENAPDFGWTKQLAEKIAASGDNLFIVAHSFGASLLLKYLSENGPKTGSQESSLSLHRSGMEMKRGKPALSCKKILQRSCQKEFRFFSTTAVMMKKRHFLTSRFTGKSFPAPAFVKYFGEAIK